MTMKTSSKSALIGFFAGVMVAVAPSCGGNAVCDASTCASGCCDGNGACQPGTATSACGTGARACVACLATQTCGLGSCSSTNNGTGGGGGATGGGSATGGGGGGVNASPIVVNEIASSDGDFFELFNTGTAAADLSGYVVADLDSATGGPKTSDGLTLPSGTSIAAGGFLLFTEGTDAGASTDCLDATVGCFNVTFGLSSGNGDAVFLLDPAGTVVASSTVGPAAHRANLSVGRIPDGTGTFVETARTPGFANALAVAVDAGPVVDAGVDAGTDAGIAVDAGVPVDAGTTEVVFNEVGLNQGDFVELKNLGTATVDLSGWTLADLDTATGGPKTTEGHLFPANTTIAPGAYLLNIESATGCADAGPSPCQTFGFGLSLGNGDAVFLINPAGATVVRLDIPANSHASGRSYGRIPDGTGSFVDTTRTMGATNQP